MTVVLISQGTKVKMKSSDAVLETKLTRSKFDSRMSKEFFFGLRGNGNDKIPLRIL